MIVFQNGVGAASLKPSAQKRWIQQLVQCDHENSLLYQLNQLYNGPWHTGGMDHLGCDPAAFMRCLAHAARSPDQRVVIQGTVHSGDAHASCFFPGYCVKDRYLRCHFGDGQIYHLMVAHPEYAS